MDNIDRKIILELQANARLSNQELADRVSLSPSPCLRRVKKLENDGVLIGYTALIDQEKCGLALNVFIRITLEKQNDSSIHEFENGISQLDAVMECYLMTGSLDYLLRVIISDLKSYETFIRDKLTQLPGIASIESSFAFGNVKRKMVAPIVIA